MRVEPKLDTISMTLNMGPQHPATHGVLRLVLTVDGERITDVETHIGYLYRGIEKLCENKTYRQIIPLFDRLDYISFFNNELPLVMALEKLLGIQVPERAEYIRVILCELNRIASHLVFYGSFAGDVGMITPFLYGFREWEGIMMLFEAVSGSRMRPNYFRVGGVKQDLPTDFGERMAGLIPQLKQSIEECDDLLTHNEILLGRTRGVGTISAAHALDFGL
ncbi:MAG: NADH-quinone oxidoreductase subunit D, partial [Dehalococcoidia bacterium]